MTAGAILVEVSVGELLDKITILRIKRERITDPEKRRNVLHELALLERAEASCLGSRDALRPLEDRLKAINERIWDLEDDIRDLMRRDDFGPAFVAATRTVHAANEERAEVKRAINQAAGSRIIEEKSYGSAR